MLRQCSSGSTPGRLCNCRIIGSKVDVPIDRGTLLHRHLRSRGYVAELESTFQLPVNVGRISPVTSCHRSR